MTEEKVLEVIQEYESKITDYTHGVRPYPHDQLLATDVDGLEHVAQMLSQIRGFLATGRKEKVMRWLGFAQGVLWACRVYDINELKTHNRPDDQERESIVHAPITNGGEVPIEHAIVCRLPPPGWECSRTSGHDGPCSASPVNKRHNPITTDPNPIPRNTKPALSSGDKIRFPVGTPVKIVGGGPAGTAGMSRHVESHVGTGYGVLLEGGRIVYAEEVILPIPSETGK